MQNPFAYLVVLLSVWASSFSLAAETNHCPIQLVGYQMPTSPFPHFVLNPGEHEPYFWRDHIVGGRIILPAAGFLSAALSGARTIHKRPKDILVASDVRVLKAKELSAEPGATSPLNSVFLKSDRKEHCFSSFSNNLAGESLCHMTAKLSATDKFPNTDWRNGDRGTAQKIPRERMYAMLASRQLPYGPFFQGLDEIEVAGNTLAFGRVQRNPELPLTDVLHPTVIDASLQLVAAFSLAANAPENKNVFVPMIFGKVVQDPKVVYGLNERFQVAARLKGESFTADTRRIDYDMWIGNEAGETVMVIEDGEMLRVDSTKLGD